MADRCPHDLLRAQCALCTPQRRGTPAWDDIDFGPWFSARFESECDECGGPIQAGDDIRSDGAGEWLCAQPGCGNPP